MRQRRFLLVWRLVVYETSASLHIWVKDVLLPQWNHGSGCLSTIPAILQTRKSNFLSQQHCSLPPAINHIKEQQFWLEASTSTTSWATTVNGHLIQLSELFCPRVSTFASGVGSSGKITFLCRESIIWNDPNRRRHVTSNRTNNKCNFADENEKQWTPRQRLA